MNDHYAAASMWCPNRSGATGRNHGRVYLRGGRMDLLQSLPGGDASQGLVRGHQTGIWTYETPDEAYCACAEWLMTRGAENIAEGRTGDCWDAEGN